MSIEMSRSEIYDRLRKVGFEALRRSRWPASPGYQEVVDERLIRPAVQRLAEEAENEEQVDGAEAKLRLILGELTSESRRTIARGDSDRIDSSLAIENLNRVMASLCPLWPFC